LPPPTGQKEYTRFYRYSFGTFLRLFDCTCNGKYKIGARYVTIIYIILFPKPFPPKFSILICCIERIENGAAYFRPRLKT
jgi:hypothetical protein